MKLERVNLNSDKNQVGRKKKNNKNNLTTPNFGLPKVKIGNLIDTIEYDYPNFHLLMDCFWCEIVSGELKLKEHENAKWLTKEHLDEVEWLPSDVILIDKIRMNM